MRFSAKRREDPILDLTPMIDIVFQLVLFFVVTTDFVNRQNQNPGLQVDLPRASAQTLITDDKDMNVWMTAEGAVYLDDAPVSLDQLRDTFESRARANPNTMVIIKADLGVPHGRVVSVMDIARAQGLTRLAIATDPQGAAGDK